MLRLSLKDPGAHDPALQLLESDGDWAVVLCARPFPIGATLIGFAPEAAAPAEGDWAPPGEYRIKVRGARREDARWFRIEGRLVSLSKEQREELLARLGKK